MIDEKLFHKTIQCYVFGCEYDFLIHQGILLTDENSSTDMGGTINFFKSIDVNVKIIEVISGKETSIWYILDGTKWYAFDKRQADAIEKRKK